MFSKKNISVNRRFRCSLLLHHDYSRIFNSWSHHMTVPSSKMMTPSFDWHYLGIKAIVADCNRFLKMFKGSHVFAFFVALHRSSKCGSCFVTRRGVESKRDAKVFIFGFDQWRCFICALFPFWTKSTLTSNARPTGSRFSVVFKSSNAGDPQCGLNSALSYCLKPDELKDGCFNSSCLECCWLIEVDRGLQHNFVSSIQALRILTRLTRRLEKCDAWVIVISLLISKRYWSENVGSGF